MPTNDLMVLLTAERDRLNRAIEALQGPAGESGSSRSREGGKRHFSAATRRRMALAQKRRWAAARRRPSASDSTTTSPPPKRRISEEGMRRIVAAAKKRWARHRAEQAKGKRESVKKGSRVPRKTAARKKAAPPKAS
jgi:hypothetical protein